MVLSAESISVTCRFFEAIDILIAQKKLRGLQTFTKTYSLNYGNTCSIKENPTHGFLKSECLVFLCRDFNVNPEWLLLGSGSIFKT